MTGSGRGSSRARRALAAHPTLYSLARSGKDLGLRLLGKDRRAWYRERARRIHTIEREVQEIENQADCGERRPVLFFNASSHLQNVSFNAAAGLVTTWGLRVAGQPVVYLVCQRGLRKCVMGTSRTEPSSPPPCAGCIEHNTSIYPAKHSISLTRESGTGNELEAELARLSFDELVRFRHGELNIGELCLASARWALRRHGLGTLDTDRLVLAQYIESAISLADKLGELLNRTDPHALLLFNGTFYPEATARAVAMEHGVPVVTFEVGHLPLSVFFSPEVASRYSIDIPPSFQIGPTEDAELDEYLAQRFEGNFTMAGIRFWPEMNSLDGVLKQKVERYNQVVTVFTNVIFDTSQVYANTVFEDMFDWLRETMELAAANPNTLFIVRAHPDELRHGKESQEPVEQWLNESPYAALENVAFIPPTEFTSSYELMRLSKFCVVYNSTVGLEGAILGLPVITGGQTRYGRVDAARLPESVADFRNMVQSFLETDLPPLLPGQVEQARRYLYYSLFRAELSLSDFIEPIPNTRTREHTFRQFSPRDLHPKESAEMAIIHDGIAKRKPFRYDESPGHMGVRNR